MARKKVDDLFSDDSGKDPLSAVKRKAQRLRAKIAAKGKVPREQRDWLDRFDRLGPEAMDKERLASDDKIAADIESAKPSEPEIPSTPVAPPANAPAPVAAPPPPFRDLPPPPPAPPSGAVASKPEVSSGLGWRAKYTLKIDGKDVTGREATCVYVASLHHGGLKQLHEQIKDAGVEPMVNPDDLRGVLVLAWDGILPPDFVLTPEIIAGASTSALLVQRFLHRKKISENQSRKAIDAKRGKLSSVIASADKPADVIPIESAKPLESDVNNTVPLTDDPTPVAAPHVASPIVGDPNPAEWDPNGVY